MYFLGENWSVKHQKPLISQGMENLVSETLKNPGILIEVREFRKRLGSNFFHPSFNLAVKNTVLYG